MYIYAQLNSENVCVGISQLSGEVSEYEIIKNEEYNPLTGEYELKSESTTRMIAIPVYSENFLGLQYTDGKWEKTI